jgi:hypothetical protein
MLRCLGRFGPTSAGERFLHKVVLADYDGSENAALADAAPVMLAAPSLEGFLVALVEAAFLRCPRGLCELAHLLETAGLSQRGSACASAMRRIAGALADALPGCCGCWDEQRRQSITLQQ